MRYIDLPFPSFALVMSKACNFDPSRLPAYRSSYVDRFHPYPRGASRRTQDSLMTTVDYRYREEPTREGSAECASSEHREEVQIGLDHTSTIEHDSPAIDGEWKELSPEECLRRSKLAVALSELLATLRHRYLTLQAVKGFLSSEHLK